MTVQPTEGYASPSAMSLGRFRRLAEPIPDEATLHGYLHTWGMTVQAEWVDGGEIMNPVVLRIPFEIHAAGPVTEPEWAAHSDLGASPDA